MKTKILMVACVVSLMCLFITASTAIAQTFKLPDTGQTKCYQSVHPYAEIPCQGTGQDGEFNINPMSYTDNGDGTVTDNNTGLVWQKYEYTAQQYNWYVASGEYHPDYNASSQNVCGALNLGDHSDWRLPSKKELMTILDYSIEDPVGSVPMINTAYFPNAYASHYWSSSDIPSCPSCAWALNFRYGYVGFGGKDTKRYVRCVRGSDYPQNIFVDNGDGTVSDHSTGLMWQQAETGRMRWEAALFYCDNLRLPDNASGYTDWRLPNIKELQSITDESRFSPAIDTVFFPNAHGYDYWSSTTYAGDPQFTWNVYFNSGFIYGVSKFVSMLSGEYVRCVRGGVNESVDDVDGDGIADADDQCPASDLGTFVFIGSCDTGVKNVLFDTGCTMGDRIGQCAAEAKNHGKFVSCVAGITNDWKKAGLISGKEKGVIQSCAARANIP